MRKGILEEVGPAEFWGFSFGPAPGRFTPAAFPVGPLPKALGDIYGFTVNFTHIGVGGTISLIMDTVMADDPTQTSTVGPITMLVGNDQVAWPYLSPSASGSFPYWSVFALNISARVRVTNVNIPGVPVGQVLYDSGLVPGVFQTQAALSEFSGWDITPF